MARTSVAQRWRVIGMMQTGLRAAAIGRAMGIPPRTVRDIISRYRDNPDSVSDKPRSGRPRISTARQDRALAHDARRNRYQNTGVLRYRWRRFHGVRASRRTVSRRLNQARLRARRPLRKVPLSLRHRQARLRWARLHRGNNIRYWRRVHFSDESRFNLYDNDGRIRVWRQRGERNYVPCVVRKHAYLGGSLMVWGCISLSCKLPLVEIRGNLNAQRYCDEVLDTHVIPHFDNHALRDRPIFMQDGATPHTARVTMEMLQREAIEVLDWPSRSPDLNPIEHLWDHVKRELNNPNNIIRDIQDLRFEINRIWNDIPQARIRRLILSCRRRVAAVIAANGDFTKY